MLHITKKVIFLPLKFNMIVYYLKYRLLRHIKSVFVMLFLFAISGSINSQTLELGGFVGTSYYLGELNPALPYNQSQFAYGGLARYNLNSRWAIKLSYYKGKLKGSDATGGTVTNRDLNFKSNINDFSLVAEFNFWEYFTGSKKSYFTPFVFGGISYFNFNSTNFNGVSLQPLGTEGQNIGFAGRSPYSKNSIAFPFGFGIKYSINERLGLSFEWGMRKTLTDYIDDVSTSYYLTGENIDPNVPGQIASDPTMSHNAYMQRGNDKTNDWYNYTGITLTYKFDLRSDKGCNNVSWK